MRLTIVAIGKLKDLERDLVERYVERVNAMGRAVALGPLRIVELAESRAASPAARKADEAARIERAAAAADHRIVLDLRGRAMSSEGFARLVGERRDGGARHMAFLIGGHDGHGDGVLSSATDRLSLGPMTLPHGLARLILAEQIYRAASIIAGHPYHRA